MIRARAPATRTRNADRRHFRITLACVIRLPGGGVIGEMIWIRYAVATTIMGSAMRASTEVAVSQCSSKE